MRKTPRVKFASLAKPCCLLLLRVKPVRMAEKIDPRVPRVAKAAEAIVKGPHRHAKVIAMAETAHDVDSDQLNATNTTGSREIGSQWCLCCVS